MDEVLDLNHEETQSELEKLNTQMSVNLYFGFSDTEGNSQWSNLKKAFFEHYNVNCIVTKTEGLCVPCDNDTELFNAFMVSEERTIESLDDMGFDGAHLIELMWN